MIYLLMLVLLVVLLMALSIFAPRRALIFAELAALVLLLLLLAIPHARAFLTAKKLWRLLLFFYVLPFLAVLLKNDCAFPGHDFSPFWGIALALAVPLAVIVCVLCVRRHSYPLLGAVLFGLFVGVMGFFVLTLELENINYAFDRAEPACEIVRICDKKVNRSSRNPDTYRFEVRTGAGTLWVEVQPEEYEGYGIGDRYVLLRYHGALGEPFYLSE